MANPIHENYLDNVDLRRGNKFHAVAQKIAQKIAHAAFASGLRAGCCEGMARAGLKTLPAWRVPASSAITSTPALMKKIHSVSAILCCTDRVRP